MLLTLLALASAHAETATWQWSEPVRYHAEAFLKTPNGHRVKGTANVDTNAKDQLVVIDTTCTPTAAKKGWSVACVVDRAEISGEAVQGEQDRLDAVFAEYGKLLTGATVTLRVKPDGRVSTLDLVGIERVDTRSGDIIEILRQYMARALSPLDVQLPTKDIAPGKDWQQKGSPLAFGLLSNYGTTGGMRLTHSSELGPQDDLLYFASEGEALATSGEQRDLAGDGNAANYMTTMVFAGKARFDGVIAYREVRLDTHLTNSSEATDSQLYAHVGVLSRITADGDYEGYEVGSTLGGHDEQPVEGKDAKARTSEPPEDAPAATAAPDTPALEPAE